MTNDPANDTAPLSGEIRPVRTAFLFQRLAPLALVIVLAAIGAVIATVLLEPPAVTAIQVALGSVGLLIVWLLVGGFWAHAAYAKERYEFFDHRIVAHRGTLVSDQMTELTIRNITHVKRRLPWPRYPLFGVGDVMIESAGSDASEITLRTISRPDKVYEGMAALMRVNGFQLAPESELFHEEQPDKLAVALECAGMTVATVVAVIIAMGELYFHEEGGSILGLGLSLLPFIGIFGIAFHYLDMRRRTYRVYNDKVMYEEGFLTRDDAFIPGENIADSSTRRGLIDQILGLYDVQISCQGSQGEIQFRRLRHGPALSSAVERLLDSSKEMNEPRVGPTPIAVPEAEMPDVTAEVSEPAAQTNVPVTAALWTAELRPSLLRSVAPYLLLCLVAFPLAPFWIAGIIQAGIRALCTNYSVRHNSVRGRFQFLHSTERDFSYDKVTGAVVRENPLDRFLGTVTVSVWSIGSAQPLDLEHVDRNRLDLTSLLRQLRIPEADVVEQIPSCFSWPRMLLATLPAQVLLGLAVLAIPILGFVLDPWFFLLLLPFTLIVGGIIVYRRIYYARCSMTLHRSHSECRQGWLWRKHYYARHDNIKRVELTRYPASDIGTVRFVVAGEHRPAGSSFAKRKKAQKSLESFGASSYGFDVHYAEEMSRHAWSLDERLCGNEPPSNAPEPPLERESGPALANSLTGLLALSCLITPLLLLLPVTVPVLIMIVRRRRYLIESGRVIARHGLVYRRQASILYDRIDSLRRNQNLIGKLFGNGNVTIFTAGSSSPDLELKNARDYGELYELLQRHYEQQSDFRSRQESPRQVRDYAT